MAGPLDLHYIWAIGHVIVLLCSLRIFQVDLFFGTPSKFWYLLAYAGALASYSIVVYKSLGFPKLNAEWVRRAFLDENVQYAVLATYWIIAKPVHLSLLPFSIFSLFHCLTFLRTNILPKFIPATAAPAPGANGQAQRGPQSAVEKLSKRIQLWVKGNYDKAMTFVAYAELFILLRVIVGAVTFQSSLLAPVFLAHFIRLRYWASAFTKVAVHDLTGRIDGFANARGPTVANYWNQAKNLVIAWAGRVMVPTGQGAAPAQGPGAQAAAAGRR